MAGEPGRPRIVESPEEFEAAVAAYFEELDSENAERVGQGFKPRPPTVTGIALYLGFADRRSFYDYEKQPGFSHTVRKARARIEQHHEERMSGNSPTGSIFWLKNHDWKDTQEVSTPDGQPLFKVYVGVDADDV